MASSLFNVDGYGVYIAVIALGVNLLITVAGSAILQKRSTQLQNVLQPVAKTTGVGRAQISAEKPRPEE